MYGWFLFNEFNLIRNAKNYIFYFAGYQYTFEYGP